MAAKLDVFSARSLGHSSRKGQTMATHASPTPAQIRARLDQRRSELLALIEGHGEGGKPVELDQTRVGRLSRMDALQNQAMAQETERRRQQELTRIDAALHRLDEGTYGECLECGEPISEQRLALDPSAPHCIGCADHAERA